MTGLGIHAVVYAAVNCLLVVIWILAGGNPGDVPSYMTSLTAARDAKFWPLYVMIFWGVGLAIHAGVVLVSLPKRLSEQRARRRARENIHRSVLGILDGTMLEGAALAAIRATDGDQAAKRVKKQVRKARRENERQSARQAIGKAAKPGGSVTVSLSRSGSGRASQNDSDRDPANRSRDPHRSPDRGRTDRRTAGGLDGLDADRPTDRDAGRDGGRSRRDAGSRKGRWPRRGAPRHWVAVMFTDIVDSTRLNQQLGDEAWAEALASHRHAVRDAVADHGGLEVGTQGDGFLLRFESPDAAVGCASALQRRWSAARSAAKPTDGPSVPAVRIGIHAGEVVHDEDDLVGKVINLASRVTSVAEAHEILVTEQLADHLDEDVKLVDRGLKSLKGFDRPRHLLAVVWHDSPEVVVLDAEASEPASTTGTGGAKGSAHASEPTD